MREPPAHPSSAGTEGRPTPWAAVVEGVGRDFRYAVRTLRRAPAFAVVAIATLALGIAGSTAAFSVLDAVVLRGLPYRDAGRLQTIYERRDDGSLRTPSYPTFQDWERQSAGSSAALAGLVFVRGNSVTVSGPDDGPIIAAYVSPGFFSVMGTRPLLGRVFRPDEEVPGAPHVAVISYDLFTGRLGGDPARLGKTIEVDSVPTTVVGVMPPAFGYPNFGSSNYWLPARLWQPIAVFAAAHPAVLSMRGLHADSRTLVRLRTGVDSPQATSVMATIERRLAAAYPVEQGHWISVTMQPLAGELYGNLPSAILLVSGAIALVLLLGCANVANLFLIRDSARAHELAVRTALGAGRWRMVRQLLAEALVIAAAAGAVGALLASVLVGFVRRGLGAMLPFSTQVTVSGRAVLFAVGASLTTALLVGVMPAIQASGTRLMGRIRSGGVSAVGGHRERRARSLLVSLQFALALTLLVGAGLLLQSFRRLASVPLGYDPSGVISFSVGTTTHRYDAPGAAAELYARVLAALQNLPTVQTAAAAGGALLTTPVQKADNPAEDHAVLQALYHPVSTEYLRTMRIPVVAGRWFTDQDMRAPEGFVVSARLAERLGPGTSALGMRITVRRQSQDRADYGQPITLPIVGIVGDVHEYGPADDVAPEVYLPYTLEVWPWMVFVVRAPDPAHVLTAVADAVRQTDSAIRLRDRPTVMRGGAANVDALQRFVTIALAGFALGALLLAALGLYGIVAYGVIQRRREIGIRIALGASAGNVAGLVLRDGVTFVLLGAALGLAGALASTRVLQAMLFQTTATDLTTFLVVPLVLAAVALVASYLPARWAARTDPTVALRGE
jgi:putative ABC transport system permease protein